MPPHNIERSLGRIESKVDSLLIRAGKHDDRISSLEGTKSWFRGVAAAVSLGLAAAWAFIIHFVLSK